MKPTLNLCKWKCLTFLMDTDSGMYLEQNEFLIACCEKEIDYGAEELYKFLEVAQV